MPAVTVSDLSTLPTVPVPDRERLTERPVRSVTTAPSGFEGEGFPVRRAFAGMSMRDLDPFVHMDQMGEVDYAPGEPKGTPWHPHRGFETVTYMIDGTFAHQDSQGGGGLIKDGATQWMTAGGGILHIETPPEELVVSGGLFHGVQLWVNLPARDKMIPPAYQGLESDEVALLSSADGGCLVRVIAGALGEHRGPGSTHTPMALMHATVSPGARLELPWNSAFNALVYVLAGSGQAGGDGGPVRVGQLVAFGPGDWISVQADDAQDSRAAGLDLLVLGGQPIGEPVEHYGPFVMNTRDEIMQALEDFRAGRLGTVPPNALMPHTPDPNPIRAEHTGI
ncbi:MAG: pirin family protein [Acidimicrobiales bacterium]